MNLSKDAKKWIGLGLIMVASGIALLFIAPPEQAKSPPATQQTASEISTHPETAPPETGAETAAAPIKTPTAPASQSLSASPAPPNTPGVDPLRSAPVYVGHTDRVALQPEMVRALRQLIDTSHDGLHVRTHPNGTQIVDTRNKFRHVAVAAMTPDRKIVQQDFSTSP